MARDDNQGFSKTPGLLKLTRGEGEEVYIGARGEIKVKVIGIETDPNGRKKVILGFSADENTPIHRREIFIKTILEQIQFFLDRLALCNEEQKLMIADNILPLLKKLHQVINAGKRPMSVEQVVYLLEEHGS